jgi:DeoR family transcriptional regulator, aga operon transcriptional repressor
MIFIKSKAFCYEICVTNYPKEIGIQPRINIDLSLEKIYHYQGNDLVERFFGEHFLYYLESQMSERNLRQTKMLELIRMNNGATISLLKSEFGVSVVTVRKDLEELERDGLIVRKFGGAVPSQSGDPLESFNVRSRLNHKEKQLIGKTAAGLINSMDSVIIDAGSTTLEIVRHMRHGIPITLITPALNVAMEACAMPNTTVILPGGGVLDHFTLSLGGAEAEESIARLHADKVFLGVRGIDFEHGLTDTDTRRIRLKQTMIRSSQQVIVVADSSKIGKSSLIDIAPLNVVSAIVTDNRIDPSLAYDLTKRGIQIHLSSE